MSSLLLLFFLILSLTCEGRYLNFSSNKELNIPSHHPIKAVAMKMQHSKVLEASDMNDDVGKQEMLSGSNTDAHVPSSHVTLEQEFQFKAGSSNKDGLLIREESRHKEGTKEFNGHNSVEAELGFMDYQQPKRGPSTHNK